MKQVSYEEANKSFEKFYQKTVEGGIISRKTGRKSKLELFLEQHKPPTWEEVVNAWESIGYEVSVNSDNDKEITSVTNTREFISFSFEHLAVSFGQYVYDLTTEELNAINLTIRYLESRQ